VLCCAVLVLCVVPLLRTLLTARVRYMEVLERGRITFG
jgi:hypothetical protein